MRETHKLVIEHIKKIRQIPNLEESTIVFCLESNLAFECQHLLHSIQNAGIKRWVALNEGAGGSLGWLTTNERKEAMCLQLREALSVGKLHFCTDFFSTTQGLREAKEQLESEMRNYCVLVEASKTPFGKVKKTYSGKVGGRQDDLIITLQLALIGSRVFYTEPRYRNFRPVSNEKTAELL